MAPTKAETSQLPPFASLPLESIFVPASTADFAAATADIIATGIAGFDTESKPTFSVGQVSEGPHILQFALPTRAYIFQLHHREALPFALELLQSEAVRKVGFGLKSDHSQIRAKLGIVPRAVVDLDQVFRKLGYRGQIGVRAAVGAVLKRSFPKSKTVTTSNWSLPRLSPSQLLYAANDAFAALAVYQALDRTR
jgi:ribonuclease D